MRRERKRLKRRLLIYWRCVKTASETPLNNLHSSSAFDQLKVTGRYCTRWPITALRLVIFAHIQHGVKLAWGISTEKDRSEVIKRTTIKILGHHLLHPGNGPYVKVAEEGLSQQTVCLEGTVDQILIVAYLPAHGPWDLHFQNIADAFDYLSLCTINSWCFEEESIIGFIVKRVSSSQDGLLHPGVILTDVLQSSWDRPAEDSVHSTFLGWT